MTLKEELDAAQAREDTKKIDQEQQPFVEIKGDEGQSLRSLAADQVNDDGEFIGQPEDLLKMAHLSPETWEVVPQTNQIWLKEVGSGKRRSIFFRFRKKTTESKWLSELLAKQIMPINRTDAGMDAQGDPLVVCFADLQLGKAQERLGGTPELIDRFHNILGQLVDLVIEENPRELVIADLGDACEGTSNHTSVSQAVTNDIPQSEQLRLVQRLLTEAIISLSPYCGETIVTGVDSNHMQERLANGKQNGHGDYGVANLRSIKDAFELLEFNLEPKFVLPTPLDSGTHISVEGLNIAFTHGHDAGTVTKMPQWLANQAAVQGNPYGKANVCCFGHFHHFTAVSSRKRLILGCPALESGSNWVERAQGEVSDPGVLTFRVHNHKFHGLRIFQEQ